MKNLYAAIVTKIAGSSLSTDVVGRVYQGRAPQGTAFPYVVFRKVSGTNEDTFTERIDETLIQFSLFSDSDGVAEIGTMYADLRSLFDDAAFSVTGNTLVRCSYQFSTEIDEDVDTPRGTSRVRHWPVDYLMTMEAN